MRTTRSSAALAGLVLLTGAALSALPGGSASASHSPSGAGAVAPQKNVVVSLGRNAQRGEYDSGGIGVDVTTRNEAVVSGDGRFVAFQSIAENLVPGDANGRSSVFVRDRDTDGDGIYDEAGQVTTALISVGTDGRQEHGARSTAPSISRDGRFVAFQSDEALVAKDTNNAGDVYVRDRDTDQDGIYDEPRAVRTTRVSVGTQGQQGNNASMDASISADGRYVAFSSIAATLSPADPDFLQDIYLRDRDVDADGVMDEPGAVRTVLVTVQRDGTHEQTTSEMPTISADGRFIVWNTLGQGFDRTDTNRAMDIYVRDRDADGDHVMDEPQATATKTTRLTRGLRNAVPNQESQEAVISDSGRYVAFSSQASNLVPNDTNEVRDVFIVDRDTDQDGIFDESGARRTLRVSVRSNGVQADDKSNAPSISPDGRVVVFESFASNIAPQSGLTGVYVRDRDTDQDGVFDEARAVGTGTVSLSRSNGPADGSSFSPVISADGRWIVFSSLAENLVGVTFDNHQGDVFVRGPYDD